MKHFIIALLCSVALKAQTSSNISVVSAENFNIIYRGIPNPIRIAVPGAKSFTATAPGLVADSLKVGHYMFHAGFGNNIKIDIEAVMENGSIIREEKFFKIKGLPMLIGTINGEGCYNCIHKLTKEQLKNVTFWLEFPDVIYVEPMRVERFTLHIVKDSKTQHRIDVEGNKINAKAIKIIEKLDSGTEMYLENLEGKIAGLQMHIKRIQPIHILLSNTP